MHQFLLGAAVMGSSIVGLFFLRFWRKTTDRLFLIFAVAFWLLALNWLLLGIAAPDENRAVFYAIRLLAFILIMLAIVDKNRAGRQKP